MQIKHILSGEVIFIGLSEFRKTGGKKALKKIP
jgi:hypothetical protein